VSRQHPVYCKHGRCIDAGDSSFGLREESCAVCHARCAKHDQYWMTTKSEGDCYACKLEQRIEELQDLAIWMSGCGYDFCQHEYWLQNRHLLADRKAEWAEEQPAEEGE